MITFIVSSQLNQWQPFMVFGEVPNMKHAYGLQIQWKETKKVQYYNCSKGKLLVSVRKLHNERFCNGFLI